MATCTVRDACAEKHRWVHKAAAAERTRAQPTNISLGFIRAQLPIAYIPGFLLVVRRRLVAVRRRLVAETKPSCSGLQYIVLK